MNNKTQENGELRWAGWVVGGVILLLLFGTGLEVFVRQTIGHHSVATVILALYLSSWSYVLGLGVLLFVAVWGFVEWPRVWVKRAAMSSDASARPKSQHVERPESRKPQGNATLGHGSCCS